MPLRYAHTHYVCICTYCILCASNIYPVIEIVKFKGERYVYVLRIIHRYIRRTKQNLITETLNVY